MSHKPVLQPEQICDLLNYVLCRPIRGRRDTIVVECISPFIVRTWSYSEQFPVEQWCDRELINWRIIPDNRGVGRISGKIVPHILEQFLLQQAGWSRSTNVLLRRLWDNHPNKQSNSTLKGPLSK